jgi:hypothetical protein
MLFPAASLIAGILENAAADAALESATMFAASSNVAASESLRFAIQVP